MFERALTPHRHRPAPAESRLGIGCHNRDLRTLRAALKKARPDYRFPAGVFFREDETRVRWLRPEEELLVLSAVPGSEAVRLVRPQVWRTTLVPTTV